MINNLLEDNIQSRFAMLLPMGFYKILKHGITTISKRKFSCIYICTNYHVRDIPDNNLYELQTKEATKLHGSGKQQRDIVTSVNYAIRNKK